MKGRRPKDPDQRRRRNKAVTADTLAPLENTRRRVPPLPKRLFPGDTMHPMVRAWWRVIWRSPMSSRWLAADIEGLYMIAILRNDFFMKPSTSAAAEIRQQEARFGLDVLSRRRLDWRIAGPITTPAETPEEEEPELPVDDVDPRTVLRAVK